MNRTTAYADRFGINMNEINDFLKPTTTTPRMVLADMNSIKANIKRWNLFPLQMLNGDLITAIRPDQDGNAVRVIYSDTIGIWYRNKHNIESYIKIACHVNSNNMFDIELSACDCRIPRKMIVDSMQALTKRNILILSEHYSRGIYDDIHADYIVMPIFRYGAITNQTLICLYILRHLLSKLLSCTAFLNKCAAKTPQKLTESVVYIDEYIKRIHAYLQYRIKRDGIIKKTLIQAVI